MWEGVPTTGPPQGPQVRTRATNIILSFSPRANVVAVIQMSIDQWWLAIGNGNGNKKQLNLSRANTVRNAHNTYSAGSHY